MDEALQIAMEAALERIRTDCRRLPVRYRPLLEVMERDLVDPSLDVQQLFRRAAVRDRSVSTQLKRYLGTTVRRYLEARRLETAFRLIMTTETEVAAVGRLLGYSSPTVFSRAFKRWLGVPAGYFRPRSLVALEEGAPTVAEIRILRRALKGRAPTDHERGVLRELVRRYPRLGGILASSGPAAGRPPPEASPVTARSSGPRGGRRVPRVPFRRILVPPG